MSLPDIEDDLLLLPVSQTLKELKVHVHIPTFIHIQINICAHKYVCTLWIYTHAVVFIKWFSSQKLKVTVSYIPFCL